MTVRKDGDWDVRMNAEEIAYFCDTLTAQTAILPGWTLEALDTDERRVVIKAFDARNEKILALVDEMVTATDREAYGHRPVHQFSGQRA